MTSGFAEVRSTCDVRGTSILLCCEGAGGARGAIERRVYMPTYVMLATETLRAFTRQETEQALAKMA